jgi:hypothetical protein
VLGPVLLVWNAFFLAARFRYEPIPKILPNGSVLFQVDKNSGLDLIFSLLNNSGLP